MKKIALPNIYYCHMYKKAQTKNFKTKISFENGIHLLIAKAKFNLFNFFYILKTNY